MSSLYTPACGCRKRRRSGRRCRWFGSGYTVWSRGSERPSLLCASACLCSAGSRLRRAAVLLDSRRPGLGWISGHLVSTPHSSLRLRNAKPLARAAVAEDFAPGSGQLPGRVARGSTFRKAGCGSAFRLFLLIPCKAADPRIYLLARRHYMPVPACLKSARPCMFPSR